LLPLIKSETAPKQNWDKRFFDIVIASLLVMMWLKYFINEKLPENFFFRELFIQFLFFNRYFFVILLSFVGKRGPYCISPADCFFTISRVNNYYSIDVFVGE
jgi:hypothetical protein